MAATAPAEAFLVTWLDRKRRELQLVGPAGAVLRMQIPERLGNLDRIDHQLGRLWSLGMARVPGESMVPSITTFAT